MTYDNKIYINNELYYSVIKIRKRIIYIPCNKLKKEQKYFLNAIKWVYPYNQDTLTCAKIHSGKKWILKLDIKDFFNSVPEKDIKKVITNVCKRIKREENVFHYIFLTTLNGKLPTGASTSAHVANACFEELDKKIRNLCNLYCINYSRYMDDLIFSSDSKNDLKTIEKRVTAILKISGYNINSKKIKYISDNKQQNILGLVVNSNRVRLSKEFKRKIRAMLHSYSVFINKPFVKEPKYLIWTPHKEAQLFGYLSYIKHVDKNFYQKLEKYSKRLKINIRKPTINF